LVYLWVEDYKNIHRQGFNFSPRFECKYDNVKNELTIDENKDYIKNFFGENINITAVVGKNGSGKSSVLEFILNRLANKYEDIPNNFILIYLYDSNLYEYSNFKYKNISNIDIKQYADYENLLKYYNDTIAININSEYREFESRDTEQIFNENNKYNKNSSNLIILDNYINNKEQINQIKEKFFIPSKLKINIKTIGYFQSILTDNRDYYETKDWEEISTLINSIKDKNFIESLKIIKNIFKLKKEKHKNYQDNESIILGIFNDKKDPNQYSFDESLLKEDNISRILKNDFKIGQEINIDDIDDKFLIYIRKLPYIFEIDLIDKNNININNLSFGEKQLFIQLHYILKYSTKKEYELYNPPYAVIDENGEETGDYENDSYEDIAIKNIFIFLDEFEIGLHPKWQKQTINYIVDFLKEITNINFHLILTTHSPFLLSDIPKQNIIFLDKDEDGNCIVVDGLKDKKQTFGANIHTLLSDSFFMEDGLMGEFAKGKIMQIQRFHKKVIKYKDKEKVKKAYVCFYNKKEKEFKQTQSIIGEPFLQKIVKNQLEEIELILLKKDEAIDKEIARLQALKASINDKI
jgi:predicted ATPase